MLENFRLRVFRTVAEQLSFRKAGEKLYLTQPAVTLQIKTLEEEVATKLFDRNATGVSLTAAGCTLLEYARKLGDLAEEAENELAALKGEASGDLVMGASTTMLNMYCRRRRPLSLADTRPFIYKWPARIPSILPRECRQGALPSD